MSATTMAARIDLRKLIAHAAVHVGGVEPPQQSVQLEAQRVHRRSQALRAKSASAREKAAALVASSEQMLAKAGAVRRK